MVDDGVAVIACDESASEGENLMSSTHPVFVHGSVNIDVERAIELRDELRAATGSQAVEVKSKIALAPRNRDALLALMTELQDVANIYLVEKSYFVTGKIIDLLLAELGTIHGVDIAGMGWGRQLTNHLHDNAATAIGKNRWDALLTTYNRLIRSYLRAGAQPPSVQPFFDALDDARANCTDETVGEILDGIWTAREFARGYEGVNRVELRELDPMAPSLASVSMTWAMRLGGAPFEFLVDDYSGLSPDVCDAIVAASRAELAVGGVNLPRADLRGVRTVDSKLDARVQIADVVAGAGREMARLAMSGVFDDELQVVAHEMLDFNVMASTGSPLDALTERRPLVYFQEWMTAHKLAT